MLRATFILTLSLLSAAPALAASKPAATVNGTVITESTVRELVKSVVASKPQPPSSEEIDRISQAALDSLIDLELLYQEALRRKVEVTDKNVEAELEKSRAHFGSREEFAAALAKSGMTEANLRAETRKTLLANRLLETVVWKDVKVTPQEIQAFYAENRREFVDPQNPAALIPLSDVRDAIEKTLVTDERNHRQQAFVAELRKKANIEIPKPESAEADEAMPPETPAAKQP